MNNISLTQVGIYVLLAIGIVIGWFVPFQTAMQLSTTPQGGTTTSASFYSIAANLATPGANATSSSILNPTGNDLYATTIRVGCENIGSSFTPYTGVGTTSAGLTLSIATSSTAAPATNANTNLVGGGTIVIATSSPQFGIATSTMAATGAGIGGSGKPYIIWGAGTYMTFTASATNTAQCTYGVDAFSS